MVFRQIFDRESSTYTYLLGDLKTKEACLIDPVLEKVDMYMVLLSELKLKLIYSIDTHVHADHITASGKLRELTGCKSVIGDASVSCASEMLKDGESVKIGNIELDIIYTPGHTDNSYSFYLKGSQDKYLFTGDTLLIRGTGRTDFQNGDSKMLYESLHGKLLKLPEETLVYPGHDYKGWTVSTIAEEKMYNPRLQFSIDEFIDHMNNLDLPDPKMMDIAVPANLKCGTEL